MEVIAVVIIWCTLGCNSRDGLFAYRACCFDAAPTPEATGTESMSTLWPRRVDMGTQTNGAITVVENDRVLIYLRFNSYIPGHVLFKLPVDVVDYLCADETNMKM